MKNEFINKEIAKITGLPQRCVQLYTDMGLVIPEIYAPKGRGKTRIYSRNNLYQFLVYKELKRFGISLKSIKEMIDLNEGKDNFQFECGATKISVDLTKLINKW